MQAFPVAILICDTCTHSSRCDEFPDSHNLCSSYARIEDVALVISVNTDPGPPGNSVDDGFLCLAP
jgi:hypothetical protein